LVETCVSVENFTTQVSYQIIFHDLLVVRCLLLAVVEDSGNVSADIKVILHFTYGADRSVLFHLLEVFEVRFLSAG
jgi:hypothetical protein